MTDYLPGDLVDLSRWRLRLPLADSSGAGPTTVTMPELAEFAHHPLFYVNDDLAVWMVAPVGGYSDAETAATELHELSPAGDPAGWTLTDTDDHVLTAQMMCDPSPVIGARECVVGSITSPGSRPLIELVVTHAGHPGALLAYKDGELAGPLLTGLRSDTLFGWRIAITGGRGARRCYLQAGVGDTLPMSPAYSWAVEEFAAPQLACEFHVGARNVEPTTGRGGRTLVRLMTLAVI